MNILSIRFLSFYAVFLAAFSTLILSGCSSFRTKTIWKSDEMSAIRLGKLGFSQLAREDELDKLVEGSGKNFKYSMMEFFIGSETKAEKIPLPGFTSFESIDRQEIATICQKYDLDAYVCTEVRYKFMTSIGTLENVTSEDIIIEQILFDRNGDPLIHVLYDTYDAQREQSFTSKRSFDQGVSRCMKRIMRKLNNKKKN